MGYGIMCRCSTSGPSRCTALVQYLYVSILVQYSLVFVPFFFFFLHAHLNTRGGVEVRSMLYPNRVRKNQKNQNLYTTTQDWYIISGTYRAMYTERSMYLERHICSQQPTGPPPVPCTSPHAPDSHVRTGYCMYQNQHLSVRSTYITDPGQ